MKLFKSCKLKINRGMTFIELVVVIGIFATMAGVVLFNFSGFSSNVTLQNLANQVALQIRQAQADALAGKQSLIFPPATDTTCGSSFNLSCRPSYGVYFDSTAAQSKEFVYFADLNNDGAYFGLTELQSKITIQSSDNISKVCYYDTSWHCSAQDQLHITFKRPFPDAGFFAASNPNPNPLNPISKVSVEIKSVKNKFKHIIVWSTGQIQVVGGSVPQGSSCGAPGQLPC